MEPLGSSLAPRRRERTGSAADHRGSVDYNRIMTSPSIGVLRDPKVRYAHEHRTIRVLTSLRGNDSEDNSLTSACNQHLGDLALARFLLGVIQSSALLSLWPPYALVAMARRRMQSDGGEAVIRRDLYP